MTTTANDYENTDRSGNGNAVTIPASPASPSIRAGEMFHGSPDDYEVRRVANATDPAADHAIFNRMHLGSSGDDDGMVCAPTSKDAAESRLADMKRLMHEGNAKEAAVDAMCANMRCELENHRAGTAPTPGAAPMTPAAIPAPTTIESTTTAREAAALVPKDAVGRSWEIVVIQDGVSANLFDYPADVLERDAHVFEGVSVSVSWEALDHHDPVGTLRAVAARKVDGRTAITAVAEIDDATAQTRLLDAYRAGRPYEFSIDAQVRAVASKDSHGRTIQRVTAITKPTELTIVRRGAAGGRVMRLVASAPNQKNNAKNQEGTTMPANAENTQIEPGAAERRAKEAEDALTKAQDAEKRIVEAEKRAAEALKKAEELQSAAIKRAAESEFKVMLGEKIQASRLTPEARDRVRESFIAADGAVARVADAAAIDAAIEKERAYLNRVAESLGAGKITGCAADPTGSTIAPEDKWQAAMDGFFAGDDLPIRSKQSVPTPPRRPGATLASFRRAKESYENSFAGVSAGDRVPRFRSFRQAADVVINHGRRMEPRDVLASCFGYHSPEVRASETYRRRARESMVSSDFAQVLGDSIRRQMLSDYAMDEKIALIRRLASSIVPVQDFRTNRRMRVGGYGLLATVGEAGTYPTLTSPGDEEATFAIAKKGGLDDITIEMVANDDVGLISKIPQRLAAAAVETLYQDVLDNFANNSTLSYDSAAMFIAGNATSSAFGKSTMNTARKVMRQQAGYGDSTKKFGSVNLPKLWLGPADLEEVAHILFRSGVKATTETSTTVDNSTVPNLHQDNGVEYHVVDYWTDTAGCLIAADPSKPGINTLELGFFQGKEEPELLVQDAPTVGSVFTADKITYKIRYVYGYAFLERKHFYGFSRAV